MQGDVLGTNEVAEPVAGRHTFWCECTDFCSVDFFSWTQARRIRLTVIEALFHFIHSACVQAGSFCVGRTASPFCLSLISNKACIHPAYFIAS